jgi:hypothetical protein
VSRYFCGSIIDVPGYLFMLIGTDRCHVMNASNGERYEWKSNFTPEVGARHFVDREDSNYIETALRL